MAQLPSTRAIDLLAYAASFTEHRVDVYILYYARCPVFSFLPNARWVMGNEMEKGEGMEGE